MVKIDISPGWVHQAYRYEVDQPVRHPMIPSHEGAKRFAWNWGLALVESQMQARNVYRVLAIRSGASVTEAEKWAKTMVPVPWSKARLRHIWNDEKDLITSRSEEEKAAAAESIVARQVFENLAVRQGATAKEARNFADRTVPDTGWWPENSKEAYSSAFEALATALTNYVDSAKGRRKGARVGWPHYKGRRGRQSVSFTTGAIKVVDRHHVQLPVIGVLRVKEPTDKLRCRLDAATARILRASLVTEGAKTCVSFSVIARREEPTHEPRGVCGHDVGISALVVDSDGCVTANPRAGARVEQRISRYQRRRDRQHRTGSPACFDDAGEHSTGVCHWKIRSKRAMDNNRRLTSAHQKAANVRKDTIQKVSHHAATTHAVNIVENLNVDGMGRKGRGKRGFNRAAKDAALAELRRELSYKCPWHGSSLWFAGRWYASSKICSSCRVKKAKLPRSARIFHCDSCGLVLDRDLNAAKNLAALAELAVVCLLAQMSTGQPVDWSKLPIQPHGWEPDQDTRSSRECARAGGRKADGGERKTARAHTDEDCSFDREVAKPLVSSEAQMSKVA